MRTFLIPAKSAISRRGSSTGTALRVKDERNGDRHVLQAGMAL
jgi:hypothetical protein